jgi:phosphotriesterase-related protein
VRVIEPYLLKLRDSGCAAFVDCTPEWLGRDPLVLRELSQRTGLHILTNTGWYNAPMTPPQAYVLDAEAIAALWAAEACHGIGGTGIRPGFIKIALNSGNHRPPPLQLKLLRAAVLASRQTGLPIVAHTIGSTAACEAAALMEQMAFDTERFIWAHADAVNGGMDRQIELARRGMWISLDGINDDYEKQTSMLRSLQEAGVSGRVLISQDSGWYNVGEPSGGTVRPYHTLFTGFIPYAASHGVDRALLDAIVTKNAARSLRIRETEGS